MHQSKWFSSLSNFEQHLGVEHDSDLTAAERLLLSKTAITTRDHDRSECPLCSIPLTLAGGLHNHLANHLERLAVHALPRHLYAVDGEEAGDKASQGAPKAQSRSFDFSDATELSWHSCEVDSSDEMPVHSPAVADDTKNESEQSAKDDEAVGEGSDIASPSTVQQALNNRPPLGEMIPTYQYGLE